MPERRLQFGEFSLDQRNACLWHGTEALKLKPKAFDVLCYLVEHSGQLVSKDDLWRAIWPDVAVTDGVLAVCLTEIRQVLGDDAKAPRFIETVHRRGYRFLETVASSQEVTSRQQPVSSREEPSINRREIDSVMPAQAGIQESRAQTSSESPWIPTSTGMTPLPPFPQNDVDGGQESALSPLSSHPEQLLDAVCTPSATLLVDAESDFPESCAPRRLSFSSSSIFLFLLPSPQPLTPNTQSLPLPDKPSIIVLPLVNLSNDPEQEYFSDGLTEVLTGDLSRISSLFVIARNSAFTYKGQAVKVQDVSKEMGVRYVLEGSVQKADQRVRINVQLIDATTGYHVWSQLYDRPLQDIFALQDEIVQKIVTTLKLQLALREQGILVRKHTNNVEAYDAFLRGVEYYQRFTKEGNAQARQMFEQAVALDPQYAEAYAHLGVISHQEWLWRWSADPQTVERALALAQRAVALDDSLPLAHALLGGVYALKQQYEQAIAEGERAVALDPNRADTYANQALVLNSVGKFEEALRAVKQAIRLNPRSPSSYLFQLGWTYRWTGQYAEAIATHQELISQNATFLGAHLDLAASYLGQWLAQQSPAGQTLAPAMAAVQRALALNDSLHWSHIVLGCISLYQQQYDQALVEMERAVALAPTEAGTYAALAAVLSCVSRTEDALEAAAQALRLKPSIAGPPLSRRRRSLCSGRTLRRGARPFAALPQPLSQPPASPSHLGVCLQRVRPRC